jgi:hypothetical protein
VQAQAEVQRDPAARPRLKLSFGEKTKPLNGERLYSERVPPLHDFSGR